MKEKHYPGDKEDTESFGSLFEMVGGILFSYAIIKFLNSLGETIFNSIFITASLGYVVFMFGYFIKKRDWDEVKSSIKYLMLIIGLFLILISLILLNSR